jgi:hypothetical protein
MPLESPDRELLRAWDLFIQDPTDEVFDELERLLPTLISAGYADADEYTWSFSDTGIARAEALERGEHTDQPGGSPSAAQ